jgi:hypothetical protein
MRLRVMITAALATAGFTGCSSDLRNPTSPGLAVVTFDSLTVVSISGVKWAGFALHNSGAATARSVVAYWHFTGQDSVRSSPSNPPDLAPGQSGFAVTALLGNPAWTYPTRPDSLHWQVGMIRPRIREVEAHARGDGTLGRPRNGDGVPNHREFEPLDRVATGDGGTAERD